MSDAANNHLGHDGGTYPDSYYVRLGEDRLVSTLHSQGAWQPGEQHLAPASGLVLAEIERRLPSDKLVSRATFDVLGVIHSGEFTIDVEVIRPGRTIELVAAHMRHGDRTSVTARVWRLQASETEPVAGDEWPTPPGATASPTAPCVTLVATANGLPVRADPKTTVCANVDLSVHLTRVPEAGWIGFDTRVALGPTGLGETSSVISDSRGPIGTAAQSL